MTRLFIGTAAYRSVDADTVDSMLAVALGLRAHSVDVVGYRVAEGHGAPRNAGRLAAWALEAGADTLLYHDADMRFDAEAAVRIVSTQRTMDNPLAVVCAPYERAESDGLIVGRLVGVPGAARFTQSDYCGHLVKSGAIVEAEFMGLGFAAIPTALFRKLERPWFQETFDGADVTGPDVHLCRRVREAGGMVACDFGCRVAHRSRKWTTL